MFFQWYLKLFLRKFGSVWKEIYSSKKIIYGDFYECWEMAKNVGFFVAWLDRVQE